MKILKKIGYTLAIVGALATSSVNAALLDLTTFIPTVGISGGVTTSTNFATLTANSTLGSNVSGVSSFDWFFQANDYLPYNDYGYMTNGSFNSLSNVATVGNYGNSGWNTFIFGSAYTGYLEFGVINLLDNALSSQLHIQNVVTAVPEPETYAMLLAGLSLLGFSARRRNKNV